MLLLGIACADSSYLDSLAVLATVSFVACLLVWGAEYLLMLQPVDRIEIRRMMTAVGIPTRARA